MDVRISREVLFCDGQIPRINNHRKIRTATHLVSGIDRIIEPLIKMSAERRRKVSSCGETEHADALRVNLPLRRVGTHDTERALCVLKRGRGFGIRTCVRNTVLQQNTSDSHRVEPLTHFRAFQVNRKNSVAAGWKHKDGRARALALE